MRRAVTAGALAAILTGCPAGNSVDAAFGGSQVFDGGEFTIALPKDWKVEKNPIQNYAGLLLTATPNTARAVFAIVQEEASGGPPLMSEPEAIIAYATFRISMVESTKGYDVKLDREAKAERVGKSLGYTAAFSFSNGKGRHSCEFASVYKQPKYYMMLLDDVSGPADTAKFKAIFDTFLFK